MKILSNRKLYLPALSIVAAVVILLVFIGFSTFRNLNTSRMRAMELVHRQGASIVEALEAGVRAGLVSTHWEKNSIARLLVETAKNEDISYIYLTDASGMIKHHSNPSMEGKTPGWNVVLEEGKSVESRLISYPDASAVYEITEKFSPFDMEAVGSDGAPGGLTTREKLFLRDNEDAMIVVGLKMSHFDQARREDIRHAVIMVAIVAALGSGALFFIFVIQNYYLVNRTLEQTRDYARQVVASMPSGLMGVDENGKILSYNQSVLDLLGLDENKIGETRVQNLVDCDETGVKGTMERGTEVLDKEIVHKRPDGKRIPLALSATPLREKSEKYGGAVLVFRDLREIKRLEKKVRQAEKLAVLGQLSAAVAHEIRNPLSSIRGFAKFLIHILKDRPKDREYAEIMVKEVDRINQVVSDLLTFARPLKTKRKPADVAQIIDHAVRLMEPELASKKVRIRKRIDADLRMADLDKDQITQVLLNLLLNAANETPPGSDITVGASCKNAKTSLVVWVEDEGTGVPLENQKSIFDPFYTTKEKGAGLGLSIVKKIVENHDGKTFITSPPVGESRGARVGFRIPMKQAAMNTNGDDQ